MSGSISPDFSTLVASAESGNNPNIGYHNRSVGTAAGRYGITDPTWNGLAAKYPHLGLNAGNRLDPAANERAFNALAQENAQTLNAYGVQPNNTTLGLANFLGPKAAAAVVQADPNTPIGDVLASAVGRSQAQSFINSNPSILGGPRTAGSIVAFGQQKYGGAAAPGDPSTGAPPAPAAPSSAPQPGILNGPIQATQLPAMPADFGASSQTGPSTPAQVNNPDKLGTDPLFAMGLGLMSGGNWREGMANGLGAYSRVAEMNNSNAQKNASLANDALNRDADAPGRAAQTAAARASAWRALNPTVTPDQALQANIQLRGQDVTMADAQARNQYMLQMAKGAPEQYVDGDGTIWEGTRNGAGQVTYRNTATGATQSAVTGLQPLSTYNKGQALQDKSLQAANKDEKVVLQAGTDATQKSVDLDRISQDLAKPGAETGPGLTARIGRTIDALTGSNIFGNLSDEQLAKMDLGQLNWAGVRTATQGTGRLMKNEIDVLQTNFANINTDPVARAQVLQVLKNSADRQKQVAEMWTAMPTEQRQAIKKSGEFNSTIYGLNQKVFAQQAQTQQSSAQSAPAAPANRPPLSSFATGGAPSVPSAPAPAPVPGVPTVTVRPDPYQFHTD